MPNTKTVAVVNPVYQSTLLKIKNINFEPVGELFKAEGFEEHNFLVDINKIFQSGKSRFGIVDRTGSIKQPLNYHIPRPWKMPTQCFTIDQATELMVKEFKSINTKINIMWSGGIDSTFTITSFLKYHNDLSQIRILYSPWSTYEHPEYLEFLKKFPQIELINIGKIGNEDYLNTRALDGCFVLGEGGDESHAQPDEGFFKQYGAEIFRTRWIDFFRQHNSDEKFIDFCLNFFQKSGREINTVLEARWWFYHSCKFYSTFFETKWPYFFCGYDDFDPSRLITFFDSDHYLNFIYYNIDKIMPGTEFCEWTQLQKDYCYKFDHLENWHKTHKKITSLQIIEYNYKKLALLDRRWIMILNDGTRISTPNLPFFSAREFHEQYQQSLDSLFNLQR
jgi:hypothetical protein